MSTDGQTHNALQHHDIYTNLWLQWPDNFYVEHLLTYCLLMDCYLLEIMIYYGHPM